ncbi:hypothetical protein DUI87_08855 [Hirundo rustica rustica]|uniref:Secreted protein n=1 Tax=Hirundo rustica rustica TaxID=333673 RepID=A0A3M0KKZ8_HIRRU|nr:hypothetical protein DUI87_08855 [Hirundo rustica rustica]
MRSMLDAVLICWNLYLSTASATDTIGGFTANVWTVMPYRDTRGSPKRLEIGMRTDVERKNGEEGGMNWEERSHTSLVEQKLGYQEIKGDQNRHKKRVGV